MPKFPPFRWNAKAGRYMRPNGQFVSWTEVIDTIDTALLKEQRFVQHLIDGVRSGAITLEEWQVGMREMIKNVHLISAASARGGWAQMTQVDYGRVGNIVRNEYGYLNRLVKRIASGQQPLDGNFKQYSLMYADAGRDTYFQTLRTTMAGIGMEEERNIRNALESCSGCIAESARGWVPIGTLVPIGRRQCLRNCRCVLEFREGA